MADNDTYQYQDDDAVKGQNYESYVEESNTGNQSPLNNPKLIGAASLVVGIYIIGYVFSMFYQNNATPTQPQPVAQVQQADPNQSKINDMNAAYSKQQMTIQQLSASNQQLNMAVNDLKKNVTMLKNNQKNLSSNQTNVVKSDLDALHNELADLRDRIILTEKTIKGMMPKPPKKPLTQYYLRGIIEGRAWVADAKGENVTVRVGDTLVDYGKITGIFPDNGFIMTSSKRMISFSKGDS